ncbi:helix-turn-helix domain-containing protein [Parabacteroides sp. OttesenSCG-928-J18]|nr:helix-turn-helix domain-containing protein [Parabacteroides sp. OttesenSCG-928-J18]
MKHFYYILFTLLVAGSVMAQNKNQLQKDSLRRVIPQTEGVEKLKNYRSLVTLYTAEVRNPHVLDTACVLLDEMNAEAEKMSNTDYQVISRYTKLLFLSNAYKYDEVIKQAPAILDFIRKQKSWNSYYHLHTILVSAYLRIGKTEQALQTAQEIHEQAKEQNHAGGMAYMLRSMSSIYANQSRLEESEKCLKECIELIRDSVTYSGVLSDIYISLMKNYTVQRRYDEALRTAEEATEINRQYEKQSERAQPGAWANLYDAYTNIYMQTEKYDLAEVYLNKYDSITGRSDIRYSKMAQILYGNKQYDKALEMVDKAIEISRSPLQDKGVKLMILIEKGEAREGYLLFKDVVTELESTHNKEYNAQVDEIRTQYEVDRHILEKERNRNYAYLALIGLGLALLALGIWIIYSRRLLEKNRNLVRRLREQDELARQLEEERASLSKLRLDIKETDLLPGETPLPPPADPLYERLIELVNEQVYTDPELNRASLAVRTGTNERYLSDLIKQYFNQTVSSYITTHRLRHARQLLGDPNTEYTIEAIALDSGFGSRTNFHKLFRKAYGLSPSEFRRLALEETALS